VTPTERVSVARSAASRVWVEISTACFAFFFFLIMTGTGCGRAEETNDPPTVLMQNESTGETTEAATGIVLARQSGVNVSCRRSFSLEATLPSALRPVDGADCAAVAVGITG
jgi:hypothetical protein